MRKDIYVVAGDQIRAERKKAGLTMEQLAALAGISPSFLAYIETRGSTPSLATIGKPAETLDIVVADLFQDVAAPKPGLTYALAPRFSLLVRDRSAREQEALLDIVKTMTTKVRRHGRKR